MLLLIVVFCILIYIGVLRVYWPRIGAKLGGRRDIIKDLAESPRTKSEQTAITELERLTGANFPTVRPSWLHGLELDGYSAEQHVALEFSGPLHTKWFPAKEEYATYIKRVETDALKKKLCGERGVVLITVDMRLPPRHYRDYFASRLYDAGRMAKPDNYIAEQIWPAWTKESA